MDRIFITRERAKEAGLSRFFVGEICKRGHVAEQYVVNLKCSECSRLEMRENYWKNPELKRKKAKEYADDPANKEKIAEYKRKHKRTKPSTYYTNLQRERESGRSRPEVCELCAKPNNGNRPIYWDHCHQTGKFRGWLCHRCNTVLGQVEDNAVLLHRLADYLERGLKYAKWA